MDEYPWINNVQSTGLRTLPRTDSVRVRAAFPPALVVMMVLNASLRGHGDENSHARVLFGNGMILLTQLEDSPIR